MQTEIFTLCDAATLDHGKLNILGSFDTIWARAFPLDHPMCAVACKLRFEMGEDGKLMSFGSPTLDASAIAALKGWKAKPRSIRRN